MQKRTLKKRLNAPKALRAIWVLTAVQSGLALVLMVLYWNGAFGAKDAGGIALSAVFMLMMLWSYYFIIRNALASMRQQVKMEMIEDSLKQVEELNFRLRAQRHDFLNHLQVVHALIELKEYQEADKYIDQVYGDIKAVGQVLGTAHPAVNALLQAKMAQCADRKIDLRMNISDTLKEIPCPSWELCRILGNLIDNAMYAVLKQQKPQIMVTVSSNLRVYDFSIENNGEPIDKNNINHIFEPGFTTKGQEGEGMGLAIVKELVSQYGGEVKVTSDKTQTVFSFSLPRTLSKTKSDS